MKTYSAKPADIERKWYLIDAEDAILGRLAVLVANRLRGKHKPIFTPHMDCGDHIIVVNAEKVHLSGPSKRAEKRFYWHTGYPGGIKERTMEQILSGKYPERVIQKAVERMIPRGPLGRQQLRKLHLYNGPDHPHAGQKPEPLDIVALNAKNKRRA